MSPEFSTADPATWPVALNAAQVAAIYQRKVLGLKKSCQENKFIPAPFQKQPYLWKKAAVMRHLGLGELRRSA